MHADSSSDRRQAGGGEAQACLRHAYKPLDVRLCQISARDPQISRTGWLWNKYATRSPVNALRPAWCGFACHPHSIRMPAMKLHLAPAVRRPAAGRRPAAAQGVCLPSTCNRAGAKHHAWLASRIAASCSACGTDMQPEAFGCRAACAGHASGAAARPAASSSITASRAAGPAAAAAAVAGRAGRPGGCCSAAGAASSGRAVSSSSRSWRWAGQPGGSDRHRGQHSAAGHPAALGPQTPLLPALDVRRVGG